MNDFLKWCQVPALNLVRRNNLQSDIPNLKCDRHTIASGLSRNCAQALADDSIRNDVQTERRWGSPRFDLAYAQAKGRLIFGGNSELIVRNTRDGYRLGHELRLNTDLEYVIFPFKYRRPTGELFGLLETSFVKRGLGRLHGQPVTDSRSTEFFLAPGLQYVASPRVTLEASWQLPVARNVGAQLLRTNRGLILGCNFLF